MSRNIVYKTLEFDKPERAPKDLWTLPWAVNNYPEQVASIRSDYPSDIKSVSAFRKESVAAKGNMHEVGTAVDAWGCIFENVQRGVHGEVRDPLVKGADWEDIDKLHIPYEWFEIDTDGVKAFCKDTDKFILSGFCARPFERMQFIRGSAQLYMDLVMRPDGMMEFMKTLHKFNCDLMEAWGRTDVDALFMMDDWGAQNNLLISPDLWVELFKPMYKDYCDIAKAYGKKMFMHSDGNILKIYPHLIEIGVDALNSQIFCMGLDELSEFAGKITFWGEMDRQHLLVDGTTDDVHNAVLDIKEKLWKDGGCIAQCEFSAGGKPENVRQMFKSWTEVV